MFDFQATIAYLISWLLPDLSRKDFAQTWGTASLDVHWTELKPRVLGPARYDVYNVAGDDQANLPRRRRLACTLFLYSFNHIPVLIYIFRSVLGSLHVQEQVAAPLELQTM